jgi:hypothetical protein
MGAKTKTVGGTKQGMNLSNDFLGMLGQLLNGGQTGRPAGANAVANTQGVAGVLSDILAGGGGKVGGSLATLLAQSQERNVNNLRARFGASGGTAFGTPAAYAESNYRAQEAPEIATQVGQLQLNALAPLLQSYLNVFDKNTPQAQTIQQKSTLGQIAGTLGQLAPIAGTILAPGIGSAVGGAIAGATNGGAAENPNYNQTPGTTFYGS